MEETFKNIENYDDYLISNFGRVYSKKSNKFLKLCLANTGYLQVSLYKNKKKQTQNIHPLVANAFLPNPDKLPVINHIDECKTNNLVTNLEWCSFSYNNSYNDKAKKIAEQKYKAILQIDKQGNIVKEWPSLSDARKHGFNIGNICLCCQGKRNYHGGFQWKYKN